MTKQYRIEELQLSVLLERYPYYVMVLDAANLTIQTVNPGYRELFAGRDVNGWSIREVFVGKDLDKLVKLLKNVIEDGQSIKSGPLLVSAVELEKQQR